MPWLEVIKLGIPYLISGIIGASIAWGIQGARITQSQQEVQQCKADHRDYVIKQREDQLQRESELRRENDQTRQAYVTAEKLLGEANEKHAAYLRCVAAGKCGSRVQYLPAIPPDDTSPPDGTHGASPNPVPATGKPPEEAGLISDCVVATLRANHLQDLIEKQPGY